MTDTNTASTTTAPAPAPAPPPAPAPAPASLLLIDSRVSNYQDIIDAKQSGVRHIVFNANDATETFESIQTKIAELGVSSYECVGLVQHNMRTPLYSMFGTNGSSPDATILGVEISDPTLQTWSGVSGFITALKTTYGIQYFDMMACALYSDPNWKYVIDGLSAQTGVTLRASTDDTGSAALGGDWFLESHTGVNLKDVYFTAAIENYNGLLYVGSNYWGSFGTYRRPVKSYAVGGLELWGWGNPYDAGQNNTGVSLSNTVGVISNETAMAALKTDGSVVVWGRPEQGASYAALANNVSVPSSSLTSGVVDVVGNSIAFAAIKTDGSVVIWGRIGYGGDNNTSVNLSSGVVDVYANCGYGTFAALKSDGSVVCWGYSTSGGSTTSPVNAASSLTSGVVLVYGNTYSFAALKTNGSVVTWGGVGNNWGGDSSSVSSSLSSGVVAIYPMNMAYAALKNDGTIVTWGQTSQGGTNPGATGVLHVFPTNGSSAVALKTDSSIVQWGDSSSGGTAPSLTNVVTLCVNVNAYAALKSDGSVVAWGSDTNYGSSTTTPVNVASSLTSGVIALYSTYYAFAALKSNGSVICWGNASNGGTAPAGVSSGVVSIRAGNYAFAALKTDGSVVVWGDSSFGGTNNTSASISSGIIDVYNNKYAFAALKPTSTPSYDLSMSYYTETDRLSILCSRDYRRTTNLTANSNKFTVSLTRSLQKFNYTMPTNRIFTLLVPNYQSAPYSFNSSITLPASMTPVNSNSFIITSEIGERVDISGVGTYVNYGTYVYKVETNGTYTKTTSITIGSNSYNLYGGDGFYYSGMAFCNTIGNPTVGAFTVPAKAFGDASFNLTDPTSNSAGAFTYTSSNTSVATVSGRTVTVVGAGSSTITATQAANGSYAAFISTATLTVSPATPTIGTFTVSNKTYGTDTSFSLTDPTSNSAGAFTYTSSNPAVATISGRTVTIVGPGSTTITATQAASGNYASGTTTATLTVIGTYSNTMPALSFDGTNDYVTMGVPTWTYSTQFRTTMTIECWFKTADTSNQKVYASLVTRNSTGYNTSQSQFSIFMQATGEIGFGITNNSNSGSYHTTTASYKDATWHHLACTYDSGSGAKNMYIDGSAVRLDTVTAGLGLLSNNTTMRLVLGSDDWGASGGTDRQFRGSLSDVRIWNVARTAADISGNYKQRLIGNETGLVGYWKLNQGYGTGWGSYTTALDSTSNRSNGTLTNMASPSTNWVVSNIPFQPRISTITLGSKNGVYDLADTSFSFIDPSSNCLGDIVYSASTGDVTITNGAATTKTVYATSGAITIPTLSTYEFPEIASLTNWQIDISFTVTGGTSTWRALVGDMYNEINSSRGWGLWVSSSNRIHWSWNSSTAEPATISVSLNTPYVLTVTQSSATSTITLSLRTVSNGTVQTGSFSTGANVIGKGPVTIGGWRSYTGENFPGTISYVNVSVPTNQRIVTFVGAASGNPVVFSNTITATQSAFMDFLLGSRTATLTTTLITPTFSSFTIPGKAFGDAQFNLTAPTSNSSGAFSYTSSNTSVATVTTSGTVTIIAAGTTTITVTQAASGNYNTASTTGTLTVSAATPTIGTFTVPTKTYGIDSSFSLTDPSSNSSGAFTYTSSNTSVATIAGRTVTIVGPGTITITASQASTSNYLAGSTTGSLIVNFGNTNTITRTLTSGAYVIPTPTSNVSTTYGPTWNQLGSDIVGKVAGDESGTSISVSADGTIVAIGSRSNTSNRGTVRVYKYNDVSWNQLGSDINGEASGDYSGQSVSISANGRVVAIGANMNDGSGNLLADSGHVRVYEYNGTSWVQRGGDIDGETSGDQSGISVSLSEDGNVVAIGAIMNDGSGNALSNSGHVRVYKYNASKIAPQLTNQSLTTFGPVGWDRLGGDIDGEAVNDQCGFSVSVSADGTIVAIGAIFNDATSGTTDTSDNRGHVRVYQYNASKTSPQLTNQSLATFGPVGWDRMGSDIDGEVAADQSGWSVSLSANGTAVAIGSPLYDASGVSNSGRVRVFAWNGTSWAQRGGNINGVTLNENVGDNVSLSADGTILSVSSVIKVVNYSYSNSTNTWNQIGSNVTAPPQSTTYINILNASLYSPHIYLDAGVSVSYNGSTWTNLGSLGGNVIMSNMGSFDSTDNNGSFNFNSVSNYGQINIPSTTLTSVTYVAVLKTNLAANYASIIDFGNDNTLLCTYANVIQIYNPGVSSGYTLSAGVWYVIAVTISTNGSIAFYVNGSLVYSGSGASINKTNNVYGIGSGIPGPNELWNGKISAIAIYHNRVLSASEISNLSVNLQTSRVSLSSQGNILAVGYREYDGASGTSTNIGVARVYRIDSSGNYMYSSNNTAIADVCGNIILPKTIGSTTIGITQSASGASTSKSGTIALTISQITPTIGTLTLPAKNFGDASFNITAPTTDSSGAFTYTSSDTSVVSVTSGGTVTIIGVGSATITATQAATATYASGSVTATMTVSPIAPTIGTLTAPAKNFGDASFNLTAPSSNSNGAFTYTSSNASVATVTTGGTVTVVGAGTSTITATQAATTNYTTGSVTASLVVSPIAPTIGALTAPAKNFGDASFNLTAPSSNSNGAFTYTSSNASVATVTTGGTVTVIGAGTSTITATQAASGNYTTGSVTASLVVSPIAPTIGALTAPAKNFGDASFNLTAPTSNSGGAFSYTSSNTAVATVTTGGTVTVVGAGTSTITATQEATTNYTTGSVTASLVVSPIAPTIGALSAPAKNYGDASFNLTAPTSNSGGAFTYTSSDVGVATVTSGGLVTIIGAGSTTITATQAATTNYTTGSVSASLVVSAIAPTIGTLSVPAKNYGDASFNLTAPTSDSSGAFTYTSNDTTVATVTSSGTVTIVGAGSATITAIQDATTNYTTGSVTATLTVSPIAPTIGTLSVPAKNYGDASFNLTAPTSNSDGAFTYTSSDTLVATVTSAGNVTILKVGSTTITATQDATTNYIGGSVTGTLVVSPIAPTIGALSAPAKNYGDASFNLTAPTSNSTGAFTYTSSNAGVATVTSSGRVTVIGAGTTTITASQAASTNYTTGSVSASLVVSPIAPNIGTLTVPAKNYGDASFNLTAPTSNSSGAFSYTSSDVGVATVTSGGSVTIVGAGTTTITATQAASTNYTTGSVTASFVVSPIAPTIGSLVAPAKNYGDASFNLTAPTSNSTGAFTYTSSDAAVATVTSGGRVTVIGVGSTTITATQEASGNYIGGNVTASLVVSPIAPTIGSLVAPTKNYGDASFNLTAPTSNSSGAFSYTSSDAGVATVTSGGVVTVVGAGSTTITATQEASGNFISGSVTASLVVSPIAPTYLSISQITKTYSTDVSFSLTAIMDGISNSSGAYTFSSTSNAIDICGGVATILAYTPSAITITATQAASGNYTASTKTFSLLVNRKTPTYGEFSIPAKTFGDASFSIAPYAPTTDSMSVPITYTSSDSTVATINSSGTVVTIIGQGYTTITASQDASGNYASGSVTTSFLVNRAAPTFFKAFAIPDKTFGDASFSLLPFTDGLDNTDGKYNFSSSNAELVSISAADGVTAVIHAYTPTPITIYVAIDACGNYAASSTSGTLTVARATPTIGALGVPAKNYGDAAFDLTAPTSSSNGAFTYTSSDLGVATVTSGGRVTVVGAGSTTITATQDASGNYVGGSVTGSLVVSPIAPTIGALSAPAKNYGDASFNLTAPTSDSTGAFTYTSSDTAVATVTSGGRVTVIGVGSTTITATQEASGNYIGGSVTASLVVSPIAPTIGSLVAPAKNYGDASFNLTAPTSDSTGAFTYTSSDTAVATVTSGGHVTVVGAGSTTITATQDASGNYIGGSVTGVLVVSPIAPTIDALGVPAKNYGDASFNLTAPTSNSSGAFSYTSSDTTVATVTSGGRVTILKAGSTTITATQDASGNYIGGSVTAALVVSPIAPNIGSLVAPAKNYGDASFNLTAPTSNSTGTFSYTSSNTAVATVTSGGRVTIVGAGTSTITATQAANGNYIGGSVTASLTVSPIAPNIGTLNIDAKNYGDASFNIVAPTSNSSGAFTYTSSDVGVATVTSGGRVTVVGAGSTTITATQDASGNYTGGSVTGTLTVSTIAPTIGDLVISDKNFGDASFNLAAPTSNSNGTITYTSSDTSVATVTSAGRVTVVGAGSTIITASQEASGNYIAGIVTGVFVVLPIAPTIGSLSVPAKNYGDASFNLVAPTSNSNGAFSYTSSDPTVATVTSGGSVTIVGAGTSTITALQEASGNYIVGSVTASLVVSPIAPTIGTLSVSAKNYGDASFNLTAPTSNSSGTFSYTSSHPTVATITSGGVVTIVAAGSTTITATQEASGNYIGGSVSSSLVVSPIAPTIGALGVPAKNYGDASFNLTAPTSNSSGTITYTSSNTSVATVTSGGTVTILKAGSTVIRASQAAYGNYTTGSVTATLVVSRIAPTIGTLVVPAKNLGDPSFNIVAPTSNSSGAFSYTSSDVGVATVTSGGSVTIVGAGTTTITATQDTSGNYTSGSVTASFVVSVALSNFNDITKTYGDAIFDLADPTSVDNTVGFTFASSNTSVATIGGAGGRTVTITGAGTTIIIATQAATANRSQLDVSATLVVLKKTPVITLSNITKYYGDASFQLVPSSTNTDVSGVAGGAGGAGAFSFTSSNTSVASILSDSSYVSINGVGSATIALYQSGTANFNDASGSVTVTVNKGTPVLSTFSVNANKTYGSAPFSVLTAPTSVSNGAITYSSSDTNVATIDNSGVITLVAAGFVSFTASQASTALYNSATKTSNTMTVFRQALPLTRVSPATETVSKTYGDSYFVVSATNSSNGGAFTYESDNPSVASVINASTGVISIISAGTAVITANRAQTAQYSSAPISWTIEVARATTTLTGLTDLSYNVTTLPFTVIASSASNGAVTYALQDPSSNVLTIHPTSGLVKLKTPGSAVIVASQAQGTLYEAPASITATITVSPAGNALQGATLTSAINFGNVNLEGASLAGATITNTVFSDAKLSNTDMTNVVIVGANFANADLSGATLVGATITNAVFTSASLKNVDLSGAVLTNTVFSDSDLSGANLTGVDASGASFVNAKLVNVDLTRINVANANFTNTNIKGANITDVSFSPLQKLQLLKNSENRDIGQIIISAVSGATVLAAVSETSALRSITEVDISNSTVAVVVPQTAVSSSQALTNVVFNIEESDKFYLPINENEFFQIEGVKYVSSGGVIRKYATNQIVEVIEYSGRSIWLITGSIVGLLLQENTLNTSSFQVISSKLMTDTRPFMPITLPTSNSNAPIVYTSSHPNIATINATTGEITITGNSTGVVTFTATQVHTSVYEPGSITSNVLIVDSFVHFTLAGLNQAFNLSTLALLDAAGITAETTDATAVIYVKLSDMTEIFKYQTDAIDMNDVSANDIKYYVFHRKWPAELKLNPVHAMMNKMESDGMLGFADLFEPGKMLTKHDFLRYISLRLFNTIHGVDLFTNETDLLENATYLGENVRNNIREIMTDISTTSALESMPYDASGNKYLTNDSSGNTNICRELMRQISASSSSALRFYNNGANDIGLKSVPFRENDTITFKVTFQAAATQNVLTGVSEIPSRSYTVKLVLKSNVANLNTAVVDSEMFPNAYSYSSAVTTYAPTSDSSGVYNVYSPPAPIPFSRFGYDGWYFTNSVPWVTADPSVRNHIKWMVTGNTDSSTVGNLQYIRVNLKIWNKSSLPYLIIYTHGGSWRKYPVNGGNSSITNGTKYVFYVNFNSYSRQPASIGYTNAPLSFTVGGGGFTTTEGILGIALETDSNASAGAVEFTLSSIVVGESNAGVASEKEYGFEADVPAVYP